MILVSTPIISRSGWKSQCPPTGLRLQNIPQVRGTQACSRRQCQSRLGRIRSPCGLISSCWPMCPYSRNKGTQFTTIFLQGGGGGWGVSKKINYLTINEVKLRLHNVWRLDSMTRQKIDKSLLALELKEPGSLCPAFHKWQSNKLTKILGLGEAEEWLGVPATVTVPPFPFPSGGVNTS